jgi:predicted amidohydrolase
MREKLIISLVLLVGWLAVGKPVPAHHGTAAYEDKITEFKQVTVTRFAWANPHALIDFDAKNADGEVVHWVCETAAPQALRLIGWSKTSLEPGQVVSIYLYVAKNGNPVGRLQKIVLADGSELHDTVLGGDAGGKTRYDPDAAK